MHLNLRKFIIFILVITLTVIIGLGLHAKIPQFTSKQMRKSPPKIIRTCCQFGSDATMLGWPFRKLNAITTPYLLGPHRYLGNKEEHNGIIYTHRGGFIDMGHLRDQADWTAFLYFNILKNKGLPTFSLPLVREGGRKTLIFHNDTSLTDRDRLSIAGHIAFDLSVWHEISTWFGVSYIPFIPERYSSFSPEDLYSNALGAMLGMEAIDSQEDYEMAMTRSIRGYLTRLQAVEHIEETKQKMDEVEGLWWRRSVPLPKSRFLIRRYYEAYQPLTPWLTPSDTSRNVPFVVSLPEKTSLGRPLTDYYTLEIKTNYKIPLHEIFPERKEHILTNLDFPFLIRWIQKDVALTLL